MVAVSVGVMEITGATRDLASCRAAIAAGTAAVADLLALLWQVQGAELGDVVAAARAKCRDRNPQLQTRSGDALLVDGGRPLAGGATAQGGLERIEHQQRLVVTRELLDLSLIHISEPTRPY